MKSLDTKILLGLLIIFSRFAFAADIGKGDPGINCKKPKSDLYEKRDANDAINLEMIGDFSKISTRVNVPLKAVLKYQEQDGKTVYLPVVLSGRGNSRGRICSFKPFRIAFTTTELKETIDKNLSERRRDPESKDYLKEYYDEFLAANYDQKTEGKPEKGSLFSGLGDDVKVVTHCGTALGGGDWPGAKTVVDQDQRLLAEYYLYEVLSKLKLTVEAARLAKISYFNSEGTAIFDENGVPLPKFAFFREPPTSLAKRCDLLAKMPDIKNPQTGKIQNVGQGDNANNSSQVSMYTLNYFVMNSDFSVGGGLKQGHNLSYFYNSKGEKFFGVYDFDLAGSVNPGQGTKFNRQQTERAFSSNADNLVQYLSTQADSTTATSLINRFLKEEQAMKDVIDKSLLNDEYKSNSRLLLDVQFAAIKKAKTAIESKKKK